MKNETEFNSDELAVLEQLENDENHEDATLEQLEKIERLEDAEKKAVEQISQFALFGLQSGARWYCKNSELVIPMELQQDFIKIVPDVLEECEISAPDFLAKYQARLALGFITISMIGSLAQQQLEHKKSLNEISEPEEPEQQAN